MRTITTAMAGHLAGASHTRVRCLRLDLLDGTTIGVTGHNKDVTVDGVTYQARTGILPSEIVLATGLEADNLEARGPLGSLVTRAAVAGGRFRRARFQLFDVNWKSLAVATVSYVAAGTFTSGTTSISPGLPAGLQQGDLMLLIVETANETAQPAGGWADAPGSPQSIGAAGAVDATRLSVFWKYAGASESAPTITSAGDHQAARIIAFRNVTNGYPFNAYGGDMSASGTAVSFPSVTTTVDGCMIVCCMSRALNTSLSAESNGGLSSITERFDSSTAIGNDGGIAAITGEQASAGATGATTATLATACEHATLTLALTPASGMGVIPLIGGKVGESRIEGGQFAFELLSHTSAFNQVIGRVMSPYCDATFGDARCKYPLLPDEWQASQAVTERGEWDAGEGSFVRPTTFNGFHYYCSGAGTTGGSEPTWPTTVGDTVSDGSAEWTCAKAATIEAVVESVTDDMTFTVESLPMATADDEFNLGEVEFTSGGLLNTRPVEIFDWAASSRALSLYMGLPDLPEVGDTLVIRRGCENTRQFCRDTWANTMNFRGHPDATGSDQVLRMPIPGQGNAA